MISDREIFKKGQLVSRPKTEGHTSDVRTGTIPLKLDKLRDGFIYIPRTYTHDQPSSLAVMLHGAGGQPEQGLGLLRQFADERNIILLAPSSRAATWDVIAKGSFNADVIFINEALSVVFEKYKVDSRHIAIGGFSDGASYAISIGLSNGDLFTHIIAFSPGFYETLENKGKPFIFISHGIHDPVLPIAPCSRRIVRRLKRLGYSIQYEEFYGEHEIPTEISARAVEWFLHAGYKEVNQ